MESVIVGVIIAGAALWFVLWLRGNAKGDKGCSCGHCAKSCPGREDRVPESGETAK